MRRMIGSLFLCLISMNRGLAGDTQVFLTPPSAVSDHRNLPLAVVAEYPVIPNVRQMAVNALRKKPDPLVLALPDGRALRFSVRRFEPREGFIFSREADEIIVDPHVADTGVSYYWYGVGHGTELSFSVIQGRMTGTVTGMLGSRNEAFSIVESHGQRVLRQIDRSLYPPVVDDTGQAGKVGKASAVPWRLEPVNSKRNFARTALVSLLVLHTDNAITEFGGEQALSDFIAASINNLNTAMQNSQMIRVQVANVMPTGLQSLPIAYDESPGVDPSNGNRFLAHRRWLRLSPAAASLRDAYEADIVVLVVGDQAVTSGVAYVQRPDCGGDLEPGCVVGPGFSPFAFAVVGPMSDLSEHVFPHEVGHLFGMEHNPQNGTLDPANASFPWSYGHIISSATVQARSIMAYTNFCTLGCPIQLHFSNPSVEFMSLPGARSGNISPDTTGRSRFNARTAAILAADVAEFRGPMLSAFDIYGHGFESLPDIVCDPNIWPSCPSP